MLRNARELGVNARHWRLMRIAAVCVCVWSVLDGGNASAAGFTVGDQGARTAGRAGAVVARADDLSAIEYNPAGIAGIGKLRLHLGNRFGYANENFRRAPLYDWSEAGDGPPEYVTFDTTSNEHPWQLLNPMMAVGTDFGLDDFGFALGAYAPQGVMSQKFPVNGSSRYMLTERDVAILYVNLSAAWKFKDVFGIGASFQWVDFNLRKLALVVSGDTIAGVARPVSSSYDMLAEITGADHLWFSAIVGAWYKPKPFLEFGLSGRVVPIKAKADCTLSVTPLVLTDENPNMTRNGKQANDVTFSTTLPMVGRFGARYIHLNGEKETFDLELDIVYEAWHQTDRFVVDGNNLNVEVLGQNVPVDRIVIPKNWRDTVSVRLGGDYNLLPERLTLRGGLFYESAATKDKYAYVDFISGHRLGGSIGASVMFNGFDFSLSYTYVFEIPITVSETEGKIYQQTPGSSCVAPYTNSQLCNEHYLGQPGVVVNAGTYVASYHLASLSVSYGF